MLTQSSEVLRRHVMANTNPISSVVISFALIIFLKQNIPITAGSQSRSQLNLWNIGCFPQLPKLLIAGFRILTRKLSKFVALAESHVFTGNLIKSVCCFILEFNRSSNVTNLVNQHGRQKQEPGEGSGSDTKQERWEPLPIFMILPSCVIYILGHFIFTRSRTFSNKTLASSSHFLQMQRRLLNWKRWYHTTQVEETRKKLRRSRVKLLKSGWKLGRQHLPCKIVLQADKIEWFSFVMLHCNITICYVITQWILHFFYPYCVLSMCTFRIVCWCYYNNFECHLGQGLSHLSDIVNQLILLVCKSRYKINVHNLSFVFVWIQTIDSWKSSNSNFTYCSCLMLKYCRRCSAQWLYNCKTSEKYCYLGCANGERMLKCKWKTWWSNKWWKQTDLLHNALTE